GPVAVRDLPQRAGISKEAAAATSFLEKRGHAVLKTLAPRNKTLTLTPKGQKAFETCSRLVHEIEERWQERFGKEILQKLRTSVEKIVFDQRDSLFSGLKPSPEGWRARRPSIEALPHFPMVSHRGGFPDGS